jgi:hypothetical protein
MKGAVRMRNYSDKTLEGPPLLDRRRNPESGVQRMRMGSVLADVQLALQILNLLMIRGSEDVDGTTDVAGMAHIQFFGNPRTSCNSAELC